MIRMLPIAVLLAGCTDLQEVQRSAPRTPAGEASTGPSITDAEARAHSNGVVRYWALDAEVVEGSAPIDRVVMQFFDNAHDPCPVERAELFPGWSDTTWELDWFIANQLVDPNHDLYSVVVEATDIDGHRDLVEIWARPL